MPEWGEEDTPLVIYSKPLTLQETTKLYRMAKDDDMTMLAYVLIFKALDEDGNKLFSLEDKTTLLNKVDRNVLIRVANEIMAEQPEAVVKKKLEEDYNTFNQLQLAELLHKTLDEIQQMSIEEYQLWLAYFKIKQERTNNG